MIIREVSGRVIGAHGGYRKLLSYQKAEIIYDATVEFCELYLNRYWRTYDQMVQAARSGKQNIAEGSMASATSAKTELKLTNVAKASLEELLLDYEDFLRQRGLRLWAKNSPEALGIRNLSYASCSSYSSYRSHIHASPECAANSVICLIHQATYLLRRQIRQLEDSFVEKGGFSERLYQARSARR